MNPATQQLLRAAEALSGTPIQVLFDVDLPILARVQIARHGASHHVLVVRPGPTSDYAVANQLEFLTRLFSLPKDDRYDFVSTPQATSYASALVDRMLRRHNSLDVAGLTSVTQTFMQWAMSSARSNPIGMRIDQAIFRDVPALRDSLLAGIRAQNDLNLVGMRSLQESFKIPAALAGPAAAYAIFVDRLLGGGDNVIPFEAMGFVEEGRVLLREFDSIPSDPTSDRQLIDTWAQRMGLSDWYRWKPFSA